jgi:3'-phosphoadenosine 5'-phosphosulfate sulfotransferase (PAPS reductase)/FAD synthetase
MDRTRQHIADVLATSHSPAVLCSFGKDSLLLLDLAREHRPDIPVIWFRTGQDERFARQVIRDWQLTAYSWAPADIYLLTDGERRTLVHEYGVGAGRFPVLTDLAGDGPCAADKFAARRWTTNLPFDTLLIGYKDCDEHWVKGGSRLFTDDVHFDQAKVVAPLRHLTDDAVRSAIIDRRIPFEPTPDELAVCTHCISTMPLAEFRSRYQLTEEVHDGPGIC